MRSRRTTLPKVLMIMSLVSLAANCRRTVPPPVEEETAPKTSSPPTAKSENIVAAVSSSAPSATPALASAATASPAASASADKQLAPASVGDPLQGKYSLSDATQGLKGKGHLSADIETDKGKLHCELLEDKAPNAVANFVGLARGLRPYKDPKSLQWVKRPAYDGTSFPSNH